MRKHPFQPKTTTTPPPKAPLVTMASSDQPKPDTPRPLMGFKQFVEKLNKAKV